MFSMPPAITTSASPRAISRAAEDLLAHRRPEVRRWGFLERAPERSYRRPERRRDHDLAVAVSVAEAHLFSSLPFLHEAYRKSRGPDRAVRASRIILLYSPP